MSDEIHVRYRCEEHEFVEAHRIDFRRRHGLRGDLLAAGALLFFAGYIWSVEGTTWFVVLVLAAAAGLPVIQWFAHSILPYRAFRADPHRAEERSVTFNRKGVSVRLAAAASDLGWDFFKQWLETERSFLLYYAEQGFSVLPKRIFSGAEEIDRFRGLLIRKLGKPA